MRRSYVCCVLVAACLGGGNDDDIEPSELREAAAMALADRMDLRDGSKSAGLLPSPDLEGPNPISFRAPLEIAEDTPFELRIEHTTVPASEVLLAIDLSGVVHAAPFGDGRIVGSLQPSIDPQRQRGYVSRIALRDAAGRVGRSVAVPFNVFATGDRLTGLEAHILAGHLAPVEAVHQVGANRLASACTNGRIRIWEDAQPIAVIQAHEGFIYDVHLTDDYVLSVGVSGQLRAHDEEGTLLWERAAHAEGTGRAMSADAERIVTGGWDGRVVAFDHDGDELWSTEVGDRVNDLDLGEDGRIALAIGRFALPGAVAILDREGDVIGRAELTQDATAVSFTDDGGVAVGVGRGLVRVYDPTLESFEVLEELASDTVEDVHVTRGLIMAMTLSGLFSVWDASNGELLMRERFAEETFSFHASHDVAAFGTAQGTSWLFDIELVMR